VLLAEEEADTVARELEYYQKGVAAGERALGEEFFAENEGHFWMMLETRPYMRARQGLANTLWNLDRNEEATQHFREMLQLNPGDNQGVRYSLLNLLVISNDDAAALKLIKQYEDDAMAEWAYTHALLTFRKTGPGRKANKLLRDAYGINAFVPHYLTGRKRLPVRPPSQMTWGGEDEAVNYVGGYLNNWRQTAGAIAWLQDQLSDQLKSKPAKRY
jgi:tetratricopeptide (TPR) repeat protein